MNETILPLPELNLLVTKYLDLLDDYKNICQINKYLNLIKNNRLYIELQELYKKIDFNNERNILYCTIFTKACYYGYINVAKYLYKRDRNYSENIQRAFKHSCENGHKDIAEWLYNISRLKAIPK